MRQVGDADSGGGEETGIIPRRVVTRQVGNTGIRGRDKLGRQPKVGGETQSGDVNRRGC